MSEVEVQSEKVQSLTALCFTNKQLGVACYEEISNTILCDTINVAVEDLEETLTNIKISLNPTLFVLHPKIISNKSLLELILSGVDGTPEEYRFKVLKSSVWNDKNCVQTIHNCLVIKGTHGQDRNESSYQQIACALDIESEQSRQALGALITYMQDTVFKLDSGKVVISSVKSFAQESFMRIDQASFQALQIFSEEIHPNVMKGKGRSKEGFSLFGLFDRTHSLPGRQRLRDWMARPYCDLGKILHRQSGVALAARQSNREFVLGLTALLRHFHDMPRLILRVKKVEATYAEWAKIYSSLSTAQKMLDHIRYFVTM